nr:beta-1,6-galactofuranosyltransferase [Lactobacillus gasseri]
EYVCPHKLSMYAICGMPIIVGKKSAMADFVINNKCGIVINNLEEIEKKINAISQQEYLEYQKNISKIASKMALGFYTQNAIRKIEKKIL